MKRQMPEKNSIHTLEITDMNNLGSGIGRIDNIVVFVVGGCTGDICEVKIIKRAAGYLVARIERIIKESPYRIKSDCKVSNRCGGCVYRYVDYEYEKEIKRGNVKAALRRAGLDLPVNELISTDVTVGYRNKAQYPVGLGNRNDFEVIAGFYAGHTHEIMDLGGDNCLLQPEIFGRIAKYICGWLTTAKVNPYNEKDKSGITRHIYMRRSELDGSVMVCVVNRKSYSRMNELAAELAGKFPEISSVYENVNPDNTNVVLGSEYRLVYGSANLVDEICGRRFEIAPESFWQVNRGAAERLYMKAGELLCDVFAHSHESGRIPRVLDLFCGIGTVGMCICQPDTKLYGIEITPSAVENARANAKRNSFEKAEFICCDASDPEAISNEIGKIAQGGLDAVILDPPRKGCAPELVDLLCEISPERIIYISCNPDTLARDLVRFTAGGYICGGVTPVDLFPRTGHVETVCLLSKLNAKQHIEINLDMDELDLTDAEKKATYQEIKDYVLEHSGLKVSSLYIAQVKQKCGIIERENYNKPKSEDAKQPQCPPDKEKAIKEALQHFGMI